jgi:hypothetical protein
MHPDIAVGKCQNHMPYSCANGMYQRHHTYGRDLWSPLETLVVGKRKEATSSVGSARFLGQSHRSQA